MYGWIIHESKIDDGSDFEVIGPGNISDEMQAELRAIVAGGKLPTLARRFKMYDDDGEHYYTGILIGGEWLEPLDDFGHASGCTRITVRDRRSGKWETV